MELTPVIGLEMHAELLTESKLFCNCSAGFGDQPNHACCPVCAGMPGALPVINKKAVEYAVKAGLCMGCDIKHDIKMDRKNEFCPDLPKAYQISQLDEPIAVNGLVSIDDGGALLPVQISRIHLEEDSGKMIHDSGEGAVYIDCNRCGVPLIEIVTEPDLHSAAQAKAFVEKTARLLKYAGVCDGRMEQGSLRVDVNLSMKQKDGDELGTKVKMNNLNSIQSLMRAIEGEISRQTELLMRGERILGETRRFDEKQGDTKPVDSKENTMDYRYFPDPDILPILLTQEDIGFLLTDVFEDFNNGTPAIADGIPAYWASRA